MPKTTKQKISTTDFQGNPVEGEREVSGVRKLSQTITYNGKTVVDKKQYDPIERDTVMRLWAEQILSQIASGRTLGA